MRGDVLYERSTALPKMRGHFNRPRIDKLLDEFLSRQLIVVTAGAGWGKTHAVASFLNKARVRAIWFQLSELDNHVERFWEEFLYVIESQNKETAAHLAQIGFPNTHTKLDNFLHVIAKEIYSREQVVFVFDDFHLIHDELILRFVENIIYAKLENFCIIINCRNKLSYNLTGMLASDLACHITAEDLYFTPEETEGYLKKRGIILPAGESERVQAVTEGWPMGLYLVGLSIKKDGMVLQDPIAGAIPLIFELIEKELFSGYSPTIQNFMVRASLLNSFHEALIKKLADVHFNAVSQILDNDMFVSFNPYTRSYNFHHLFLEFLNGKQEHLPQHEITATYLTAADWCAENDYKIEALAYYDKCGRYDKVLNIMFSFGVAIFSKSVADFYISLIDKFPGELIKSNPLLHVHRAGLLYNNAEVQPAVNELLQVQKELEALPCSEPNRIVLGEICCLLGLIYLGMADYDFISQFKKASEYIPNGSFMFDNKATAVNTRYAIMLNRPAPGELKKMEDAMLCAMPYAAKTMHGYGCGMEYLASAEAAYFTADMKKAAINAYEAVYRAREKTVIDVAASGYFLLMRIEAANGNYEGVASNLELMKAYVNSTENKWNFNGMPDVAEAWLNLLLGDGQKIAGWLIDDILGTNVLAPYSMGMERLIKARYLLKKGNYYEVLAWLGQSEKIIRQYNIWLVLLDILICKAIAYHHINDWEQTAAAMREAYEISHENNIITQFVEFGKDIRTVIYNLKRSGFNTIPDDWLNEIYAKAATYRKHMRNMKAQYVKTPETVPNFTIKLTKREKEILGYICKGLTNMDIASTCFITVSAVKKTLNNIYIKLGATNRADAVRIAIHKGICA